MRWRAALLVLALGGYLIPVTAQGSKSLSLYLLGHRIGAEQYSVETSTLTSHFEYLDRATKIALDTTLAFAKDFTPLSFESHGKSYRVFAVNASVPKAVGRAEHVHARRRGADLGAGAADSLLARARQAARRSRSQPSGDVATVRE